MSILDNDPQQEIDVFVFTGYGNETVRFTDLGALEFAQENGYNTLQESYDDGFHYWGTLTRNEIDEILKPTP